MKNEDIELLDDELDSEKVQPVPTVSVEKDYLQPIPKVSTETLNNINREINQPQIIDPETVSKSVGYENSIKDKKKESEKKVEPKMISPSDVIAQVETKTPQMISPEAVMEQVGSMRSQVSSQKIANVQKNSKQISNTNEKDNSQNTYSTSNLINKPGVTKIYNPANYIDDEDEFAEYKKLNKDYRITILFIAVVILFSLGIITSIIDASTNKKSKTKKVIDNSTYIIENTTGNAYFYSPLNNKVQAGNSNETTYYILGEENSGQSELFNILAKNYINEETKRITGQDDELIEIGPIKNKKSLTLILPTNYINLNERIIKSTNKDGSIIVVKASKGVTTKLEEHLRLMNQLGAEKTIVFINADDDTVNTDKMKKDIKKILKSCNYDEKTPIVVGKTNDSKTIKALYDSIVEWVDIVEANEEKILKAYIKNAEPKGKETELKIQIETGKIKSGDKIKLLGTNYSQAVTVDKIYVNSDSKNEATSKNENDEVYIIIKTKYDKSLKKANILVDENSEDINSKFMAIFYYTEDNGKKSHVFKNGYSTDIQLSNNVYGKITIPNEINYVVKNDTTNIKVELSEKMPLFKGQKFTINDQKNNVFGYGEITGIIE